MWDRQQKRRENDTRWQEIQKIISNFWWRKLSDFRFESDNFFMRKLERIFSKFLGSFARVQKAYIQWWIAFKNCNFQLNLPFFFVNHKTFHARDIFFVVREWNASGNWKKCRKLSTTALIDDFFFISIFFHFNWQLHFRFDRIWIEAKITLGNAQSCLLIDGKKMRENLLGKFLWMRNF